jgi:hypothetical protein
VPASGDSEDDCGEADGLDLQEKPKFSEKTCPSARSRDSAVGTATGYGLDDPGVGLRVPVGSRIFSSTRRPMGTGGSFPGLKRPGSGADQSPPASAEIKKMLIFTSTPPYAFMA